MAERRVKWTAKGTVLTATAAANPQQTKSVDLSTLEPEAKDFFTVYGFKQWASDGLAGEPDAKNFILGLFERMEEGLAGEVGTGLTGIHFEAIARLNGLKPEEVKAAYRKTRGKPAREQWDALVKDAAVAKTVEIIRAERTIANATEAKPVDLPGLK